MIKLFFVFAFVRAAELTGPAVSDEQRFEMVLQEGARRLEAMKNSPAADLSPEEALKGSRFAPIAKASRRQQDLSEESNTIPLALLFLILLGLILSWIDYYPAIN